MVKEKEIIGESTIKIPKNRRISLPSFTGMETNDLIKPHLSAYGSVLVLFPEKVYQATEKEYLSSLEERRVLGKINDYILNKYRLIYISSFGFPTQSKKKKKRIILPKKALQKLEITDKALLIGRGNTLILCKDKDKYNELEEILKARNIRR